MIKHFKKRHPDAVIDPEFFTMNSLGKPPVDESTECNKRIECAVCSKLLAANRHNVRKHFATQHPGTLPDKLLLEKLSPKTRKSDYVVRMGKCTVCGEEMNRLSIMRHMKKKHDLNTFIIKGKFLLK